ncbi:hypothetical protein EB796_008189 [Bugula neritina]|uniref:Uncharacterized protein n=1 Tax=Bugula neritina TaxID=10212 RepID=A0A7J7K6B0_BUGNE|nr:hypothetical protein EB796_008189 [Bugula neritina]
MYLGIPSLTLFKINQEYRNGVSKGEVDDVVLAERFFRYWYNQKKRLGKSTDRYKDIYTALAGLGKPVFAEIFQQRYLDEVAMKYDDFVSILQENQLKFNSSS